MNKEFNLEEAENFIDNVYQHKFDDMEESLEDGTQVVHLGGLDDIKFTDFESASFTLLRGEQRLKHQVQKQKEVIDRIINETKETRNILNNNRDDNMLSKSCLLSYLEIVEDLLKEVSE